MKTKEKLLKSKYETMQEDRTNYYKGYTGANAVSLYAYERYNLNCADSSKIESDLLCEIM